jgi:hypothetical protein
MRGEEGGGGHADVGGVLVDAGGVGGVRQVRLEDLAAPGDQVAPAGGAAQAAGPALGDVGDVAQAAVGGEAVEEADSRMSFRGGFGRDALLRAGRAVLAASVEKRAEGLAPSVERGARPSGRGAWAAWPRVMLGEG